MQGYDLRALGWDENLEREFEPYRAKGLEAGRVAVEHRGALVLYTQGGEIWAELAGALRHRALGRGDLPAVGDWVAARVRPDEGRGTVEAVLSRRTKFSRNMAGFTTDEQVLAANVDVTVLVSALDSDLNLRRLERYLTMAWSSGAMPVVVLTKADLCTDIAAALEEVGSIALGVPVIVTSAVTGEGIDELSATVRNHKTAVLLGSSGVGKSTLVNRLVGAERQEVRDIRDDGKGRHTTTRRELVLLDDGGILIDTPGMRELQLWDDNDGLDDTFADIKELAAECRFGDCRHESEPGCAVLGALEDGSLSQERYAGYKKLERELHFLHVKQDKRAAAVERRKWRAFSKDYRARARLSPKLER
jgi:ribosome biogenesis GTPase